MFLLLVGVFFPENPARTMFLLTLAGWAAALLMARLMRSTIIRGESTPFVMELPPYRVPTLRSVVTHCAHGCISKRPGPCLLSCPS